MGGLIGNNQQKKKEFIKANKLLGKEMRCETCGKTFNQQTNINTYNSHIKNCYEINRERNRIENLLNDLREANMEIEFLDQNKNIKKESSKSSKKTKNPQNKMILDGTKSHNNKNIVINASDMFFFNPEILVNRPNINHYEENSDENEFDDYEISKINLYQIKFLLFEDKIKFFRSFVKNIKIDWRQGYCNLEIDREDAFRQSMIQFENIDPFKELKISFKGEVSHDAGGLIREWYSIIFKFLLSPTSSNSLIN